MSANEKFNNSGIKSNDTETVNESKPRSEAQQNASRENGKKSAGPITAEGKERSSQNGTTHGLRSSRIVLLNESQSKYDTLFANYRSAVQPVGQLENDVLLQMVNAMWRMRRIWDMEGCILDGEMAIHKAKIEAAFNYVSPGHLQAEAVLSIASVNPTGLTYFERAELRLQRIYDRGLKNLIKLQTLRLGHAPKFDLTPETTEPGLDQTNYDDPQTFASSLVFKPTPACPTTDRRTWVRPDAVPPVENAA